MIKQLFGEIRQPVPQGLDTMGEVAIKMIVKEFLQQKRYVVIVDDIWSIHAWEAIKYALLDSNCGSRIMVTTRSYDIASYCKEPNGHVYNLESLAPKDSWTLFCNKAFQENSCPALQGLSENILKRCGGLPLAIVAIGGVLSTREKIATEWEMVHRSLGSLLEVNDKLESMKNILLLSYNDLPYYLKPCLLYLGIFPEDYLIGSLRLIKLWTAEGFVREKERMTAEEVAESHLYELISKSLIQVAERSPIGKVKRCRVHDFIREIILSKLRDQNFGAIAIQHNTRYLSLRRTKIEKLPRNIGKLLNLRTLDLKGTNIRELSSDLFKLQWLRHLIVYKDERLPHSPFCDLRGFYCKVGIGSLVNLQELSFMDVRQVGSIVRELGRLSQLRELGIMELRRQDGPELCSSIEKMNNLRGLNVKSLEEEVLDLQFLSSPPLLLQQLQLRGNLEKFPNWISSLHNLKNICLWGCELRDDPLEVLRDLPNLVKLSLIRAYDGEELVFKACGFQTLKTLFLSKFQRLKFIIVEEGAMTHLQVLNIVKCKMLEMVPLGLECLANLKLFDFLGMPNEFAKVLNTTKLGGGWMCVNRQMLDAYQLEIQHFEGRSLQYCPLMDTVRT
ncbi:hypothetical protein HHK36_020185 [Tetracentron sinense]|uniref:NB-ARC domain-containing protein n=1 Tax=Tetracentron sinense TaxID=13715 RepID=A0A834YWX3_TETSI|nr:hypothetical protein HHK36_020185 [Tetracentron sinense]